MGADGRDGSRRYPAAEVWGASAAVFGLLANPMRLHILWDLSHGECDVSQLAERVGGTPQAVSQHLAKLKLAGLVRVRTEGRRRIYRANEPRVTAAVLLMVEGFATGDRTQQASTGAVA
ncbi:metalloregulator ArsR/SmtB family transcription factor [Streptomyces sp. RB6PN25]|uniref:Metalloregulator ArsR/SmtB family transcription factor n=1 Tax=Streptomyces humicola TaxID=2953240 RepID=A0ABT1Q5K7_9ACTN|nr:metalloregulator ArsR/SmtB family transcription factor [Streptomyces humicola]MCQ4085170.1 metalloregulator ArsR/SmtB family transcription factor [Streptomyces humicola]